MTIIEDILSKINIANLAISKDYLLSLAPKNCRIEGFILAKYDLLLDNIKNITSSKSAKVILDKNLLYSETNDDYKNYGIIFVVEGSRNFKDIAAKEINTNMYEIKNIDDLMSEEILALKRGIFKKYLWTKDNINNWSISQSIGLSTDIIINLAENWLFFKEQILKDDSESFYKSCSAETKVNATIDFQKRSNSLLLKYKNIVMNKIFNNWHQYSKVDILNPTILEIYINQKYASHLGKNYPKLKVNFLTDKLFKEFALY